MLVSIFVIYNPDIDHLTKAVESVIKQVDRVMIIDNSPEPFTNFPHFDSKNIDIQHLKENIGIAAAQNIGIKKAIGLGAEFILLSDQDTIYPSNYVSLMLPVFNKYDDTCVVVPKFVDSNKTNTDGFISLDSIFFKQFFPKSGQYPILQAIASGKILKVSTLEEIGLMNESLFIDWVDLEWCWRARANGFQVIGNADVVIQHQLGDLSKDIGFREVNLRSPIRHYYITRNAFYLALYSKDLDVGRRIVLFFKSLRYLVGYPLLSKPHFVHLKAVFIGFWHGVTSKLGKYELK